MLCSSVRFYLAYDLFLLSFSFYQFFFSCCLDPTLPHICIGKGVWMIYCSSSGGDGGSGIGTSKGGSSGSLSIYNPTS